ncbi:cordon-bleu protein-like 1 isoform X2 [Xenopus laevis]|uniref:Cordon-bleu protein-like 1 isoform X2 n=1 Tax=Xenopus laevis TaxID=8355 RepID=A0A8J0TXI9_XENLA|nr:cordon-bleu protein-like 1 isoform X2 [Xenopus laevis]
MYVLVCVCKCLHEQEDGTPAKTACVRKTDLVAWSRHHQGMDDSGSWSETSNPEGTLALSGKKAKGKAPLPPGEGKYSENSPSFDSSDSNHFSMDQKENIIDRDIELTVVLPGEKTAMAMVHGSKPMLDLLIFLCGQYRLNPSSHTIDLISSEGSQIKFKPNTPIGMLEVERVVLKSKISDDKNKKPFPAAPEQTVRVVINYRKTQKTVMRVSPQVPLHEFFLSICNKCEFDPVHTVLLKDHQSQRPLDLTKSLNDLGIRELYAVDRSKATSPSDVKPPPLQEACQNLEAKPNEDKGFFNFFRRSKKKPRDQTSSAPTTPQLNKARLNATQRTNPVFKSYDSNTMPSMPSEVPKKRRAPLPPMHPPQSAQNSISRGQVRTSSCIVKSTIHETEQVVPGIDRSRTGSLQLSGSSSFNSPLRRTKRKAPLPPSPPPNSSQDDNYANGNEKAQVSEEVIYERRILREESQDTTAPAVDIISEPPLEEIKEKEETSFSHEVESVRDKTEDVSVSSVSTDVMGDMTEGSCHSGSDLANGSKTSEEEIMIISNKSSPVEVDDLAAGSATLEYDSMSHIGNGASIQTTETEDNIQATDIKVLHIETEVQAQPYMEQNERMVTDIQNNATISVIEIEGTLDHSSPTKAKLQDSAVQTVSFDSDVEMNSIKESSLTSEPSIEHSHKDMEINGQSSMPPQVIHKHVAFSMEALQTQEVENTSKEIPSAKESVQTQTIVETEKMVESPLKSPSKSHQLYIQDSEPKPKPSNEITRDYLPKIGMTTYKIVPQRSSDAETDNAQDSINHDTLAQHDKRLQSPIGTKSVSPVQAAREAFFSELSSAIKNGSHSPQLSANINPMSLTHVNNTSTSQKSPGLTRSLSSEPVLKSEKSNVPETKSGSVKAPSSFYLQMQRRASSLYVTSAAAKMSKSSSSPTNNTVANLGKDTLQATIKTLPPSSEVAQVTSKRDENISYDKSLFAKNISLERNLDPAAASQLTSKTSSSSEDLQLPLPSLDLHKDKLTIKEMESEVQSLGEYSQLTQKPRLDVRLPSISEDELAKDLTEAKKVETVSETYSVATNRCNTSQNITEMDKTSDIKSGSSIVNAQEKHLESPTLSSKNKSENSLSAGVKNAEVKTESLNVLPEVTKHFDVDDMSRHYEDSLTSSRTVRSPSSPTGPAVTMSLQKLRTFATPRPFSSSNSSSFAPTSSLAIRRSQSFTSSSAPVKQPLKSTGWTSVSPTDVEFRNYSSFSSENPQEQSEDQTLTPEIKYKVHSPPPLLEKKSTVSFESSDPEFIRQNLLTAIRSGEAAANLKRVPVPSNTISINGRSTMSHPVFSETQEEL